LEGFLLAYEKASQHWISSVYYKNGQGFKQVAALVYELQNEVWALGP
jgi:hypothetical protein